MLFNCNFTPKLLNNGCNSQWIKLKRVIYLGDVCKICKVFWHSEIFRFSTLGSMSEGDFLKCFLKHLLDTKLTFRSLPWCHAEVQFINDSCNFFACFSYSDIDISLAVVRNFVTQFYLLIASQFWLGCCLTYLLFPPLLKQEFF